MIKTSGGGHKKGPIIFHICGKPGHIAPHCRNKRKNNNNGQKNNNSNSHNENNLMTMFCGYTATDSTLNDSSPYVEKWLLDSGATKHMTPTTNMLHNLVQINKSTNW